MKTLHEYWRLFLLRWFGYDPKPEGEWKPITYFRARLYDPKPDCTTKDGQALYSASYTDKTIYERFEQPFTCRADNVETLPRP